MMTSRERVLAAIEHREPDRVPIDVGGSSVTTLIGEAYERLKVHLGVVEETRYIKQRSRTVLLAESIAQRLGADTRPVFLGTPDGWQDIYFAEFSYGKLREKLEVFCSSHSLPLLAS